MPLLRPARPGVDWLTGEVRQWQSEGWLEAQYADEVLRSRRVARREQGIEVVGDLVSVGAAGGRAVGAVARRCLAALGRLSRPRPPG